MNGDSMGNQLKVPVIFDGGLCHMTGRQTYTDGISGRDN